MSDAEIRFVDAAGVRLRALLEGSADGEGSASALEGSADGEGSASAGPTVLLLHGFTGAAESMESVAQGLRGHARVVRLELVGHGESEAPRSLAPYAMSACGQQIVEAVAGLGLERPHLLGYSMGGRAALAAAVARPDCFASLVLVGATAGIADPEEREERIAADCALADRIEAEGVERFVDAWMALPLFASQARLGEAALRRARAQRLRNRPHALANSLRGMGAGAQAPLHDRLPGLELPVLLVVGEEDAKFRSIADALERLLPDARTCVLPEAGHAAHLEAKERFCGVVSSFLADIRAGAALGDLETGGLQGDPARVGVRAGDRR